jgi:5'(3')-deoxyribonucleotidase
MKQTIYLDMDGVTVNWTLAMCRANNLPYPVKARLKAYGLAEFLTRAQIDATHTPLSFWTELEPYPWSASIIDLVDITCPDWQFLTKACISPWSYSGKALWIDKHFPKYAKKLIIVRGNKAHVGKPGDILIDDHPDNIKDWNTMGGLGFRWEEMTPDSDPTQQLQNLKQFLLENYKR